MPRDFPPFIFEGPFGGVNESKSPRHLTPSELAEATNVINREGRIAPRPGYETVRDNSFGFAPSIIVSDRGDAFDLDETNEYVYFSDGSNISRIDYNGDGETTIVAAGAGGIQVDPANSFLYWNETTTIKRCTTAGASTTTIVSGLTSARDIAIDVGNSKIYYADVGGIYREDITGGSQETVQTILTGVSDNITLDLTNNKIYWTNPAAEHIKRSDLDGSNTETIYDDSASGDQDMFGLAIDVTNGYLYVGKNSSGSILRVTISSGATETVFTGDTTPGVYTTLKFESNNNVLFWSNTGEANIKSGRNALLDQYRIISAYWYDRQTLGVDASGGDYVKDFVVLQLFDEANEQSDIAVWFPAADTTYFLDMGYSSGTIDTWVTNNRDADPTGNAPFSQSSGRFSFAYTGQALNTGRGGILLANGGEDDTDNPYVLNYVLGHTIWTVSFSSGSGNWTLSFNGETTANIATDAKAGDVRAALLALDGIDGCWVTVDSSGGTGDFEYVITMLGSWAGKNTPAMTVSGTGASIARTQAGGTDTGSTLFLRPTGLPRPIFDSGGTSGTTGWCGLKLTSGSGLTGVFNYRITYYSSLFDIESPPSSIIGNVANTYTDLNDDAHIITPNLIPDTIWFNNPVWASLTGAPVHSAGTSTITASASVFTSDMVDLEIQFNRSGTRYRITGVNSGTEIEVAGDASSETINHTNDIVVINPGDAPYPVIDKIRVYRRRWGGTGTGDSGTPNGVGQQTSWKLVEQQDIWDSIYFLDSGAVGDIAQGVNVPSVNEYPPLNAAFVAVTDGSAFYASTTPSDLNIWYSERSKTGGIHAGELGYEYVSNQSYVELARYAPTDSSFTGLHPFGRDLVVGTPLNVIRANVQGRDDGFIYSETLRGTEGFASHWLVAETTHLDDSTGELYWVSPSGHAFSFDGLQTRRISGSLDDTPDGTVKKYWIDNTYFETGTATLYYSSLIFDPERNQLLFATFDTSGNARVYPYSLDVRAWTPEWQMGGWGWVIGREWTGANKGKRIVCFGGDEAKFFKLSDGKGDDGSNFTASIKTARLSLGSMFHDSQVYEGVFAFDERDFGGDEASIQITPIADGQNQTATTAAAPTSDTGILIAKTTGRPRTIQYQISWTQADDRDHAELVGMSIEHKTPTGMPRN